MDTATAKNGAGDDNPSASPMVGVEDSADTDSDERKSSPTTTLAEDDGEDEPKALGPADADADTDDDAKVDGEDNVSSEDSEEESSSSEDESSSDDEDEDEDDDDNTGDDGQSSSGLSEYELLRLKRIERNKARLAELGLAGGSIAKKSGHGKKKVKTKEKTEEDLVASRVQPKRAKKSALTQEQLHGPSIARYKQKDRQPKAPRTPKKEKYVPGTCFGCKKEDDEQRIYCAYCRYQYHPQCHEPEVVLPLAEGTLFRCGNCEGKSKRLACGFCEPCNRTEDCGGCTYCIEKTQSGARKKKCIYRRCLVMFNIQPHVPGTKPLTLQVGEGPKKSKKDGANDKEGRDTSSAPSTSAATLSVVKNKIQVDDETEESTEIAAKDKTAMDVSHHEDRCFACKDGGVLICCDDCDRVWHPACHRPMVLNVYSKLHCMECKREEREAAIELMRKQEKERRNQRRLASGALAGIVDGELVFVSVVGPSPCCAICGIQRHKFKPIPLPPAKRVLYASIDLPEEEMSGSSDDESLDDKSDDSGTPLTTNVPKDVEVLNARSMRKVIKTFSSCSEAARAMSVNRTKLSRLCRKGGGVIGVYHFRYASADDEGGMEDVTSTSRKRKRKKKKKKANRPQQKIIECVVKWPRESFEEATAKKNAATATVSATAIATVSATGTGSSQTSLNCPKPIAPAQNEGVAPSATTSTPHPSSISNRNDGNAPQSTAQTQGVASSAPTSVSLPSNTANDDGGNAPQQSSKRTATGKPACSYGECLKQSQGRRYNYMCLVHFKQTAPGNSTDLTATDVEQVAPPQTTSSNLSSAAKLTGAGSTAFIFPGSGIPQQSDRLTKTGAIACAYGNCPKQSQGRRLNFMCMSHFKSITGGKMIEVPSGGDGAAGGDTSTSSWTCDNCGLIVPGSLSRCKCYRWRNGVHPMSKKKKNLKAAEAQNSSSAVTSKALIGTSKAGDDEEDTTDWDCDNCGRKVPGKLSRCKCYRWRNGIHPMSKKKSKLKQDSASISNQKYPGSLDGGAQKVAGGSNRKATESRESSVATNTSVDASKTDEVTPSNATDEKPKTEEEAPNTSQIEAAEPVDKTVGSKEVDEMEFAYEPILDATVYDSDGDDVPIRVTVKWPHENPDARRSDDMIYCNTCGAWYHLHCVSPPILHRDKGGPRGSYKCQTCISTGRNRMYNAVTSSKKSISSVAMSLPATAASSGTTRLAPDGAGTNSSTASRTRKMKCGQCDACRRPDCGECANCRDKKKFGGPHRHRQRCILKTCTNPQHRPLFSLTSSRSGIVAQAPSTTSPPAPTFASPVDPLNKADETESSVPAASTAQTGEVVVNTDILVFDEIDGRESHRYEMQLSGGKMRRVMKCRVENCNKNSRGKKFDGFCLSHFNETYPNVAIMGSMTVKLCKVLGCSRNSRGSGNKYNGMCCHHHNESLRGVVHEIKETNERVPRPKKVGKPISAKINLEPTESVGQGTGKSSLGGSEMISESSEEISVLVDDIVDKKTTAEPMKKRQLELPKDLGDDTPQGEPQAKKKRGGKLEEEGEEEDGNHDPTHVNMQNEDDGDLCVEPKPKKARITISVGQEEKEKSSSLSRNGKTKPERAKKPNTNATPAPPNKKRASLDKRNEKDLDPTSKKILKIIRTAEKYPGDAKKQDQVCEALRKHANDLDAASKMIKLGGLDIIAAAMKMHEGVPMVQAEAIGTIADLVWIDAEHGVRVAELGFIDLIASAMELHGTHPKINKLGCGFFRTCSYDKVNADRVKKIGMVAVTAAMKRNPRKCDVLKEGSVFLQNMLVVYPDLARAVIKRQRGEVEDNGIVPILVDALKNNGKDAKLHEAVCGVLSNVALIESGKSAIIKAGVIPVLMRVLKNASVISGEIALKRTLLSFLTLLATDDKANIQTMLPDLRDGGLEDTLSIIKQHPKDSPLLVAAFEFLKAIAEHNEEIADEIARSGAVKLIVSAMQKHAGFDQIQIASCALLSVVKHDESKSSTSAAKRVIDAIETHEDNPSVLEEACHALYNLATCASNVVPLIKSKDVRETLTKIKEGHPEEIGEIVDEVLRISSLRSARRT